MNSNAATIILDIRQILKFQFENKSTTVIEDAQMQKRIEEYEQQLKSLQNNLAQQNHQNVSSHEKQDLTEIHAVLADLKNKISTLNVPGHKVAIEVENKNKKNTGVTHLHMALIGLIVLLCCCAVVRWHRRVCVQKTKCKYSAIYTT
ncbi:hypothetical protein EC844_101269 [Acinetobacter calcoaceticus]|uniref:Uncharacterized protein n=1 Tax=Acinetobacter calcoaceticus TaxID=471 RepID=A0A4R1YA68_ACICA|nr:hypothetical protein EC844_101269 [Acinetobacter calcoaceticus]